MPSLLCLDAPLVALGWALLLSQPSRAGGERSLTALFLAVWSIYLADRLFDSLRPDKNTSCPPPERLAWAKRHRAWIAGLLCVVSAATVGAALRLPVEWWRSGWVPAAATALYFLVFRGSHAHRTITRLLPAKELAIGTVFAFGVLLAARGGSGPLADLPLLASLILLFSGNCLLIARGETSSDLSRDEAAYFTGTKPCRALPEAFLTASLAVAVAFDPLLRDPADLAIVLSAGSTLAASAIRRGSIPQALADAILLLPWLLLPAFERS